MAVKSYDEWSSRAKELGWSPDQYSSAAYQGYLSNVGATAPAPTSTSSLRTPSSSTSTSSSSHGPKNTKLHQEEVAIANATPEQAKFTTYDGSQNVTNPVFAEYAKRYPDLMQNYLRHWVKDAPQPLSGKNEGISLAEYGAMHYAKYGRPEGRTLTAPSGGEGGGGGGGGGGGSGGGGSGSGDSSYQDYTSKGIYGDELEPVKPTLRDVQIEGPESEVVEERVKNLVDQNSPLFRAAAGQAYRQLASRGMANSSLANQAVMDAILAVAVPIASADAETFKQQAVLNQGFTNEFKAAQNAAYYNQEAQKLDGIIREVLAHISGQYSVETASIGAEASMYSADIQGALGSEENRIRVAQMMAGAQTPAAVENYLQYYNRIPNGSSSDFRSYFIT